MRRPLATALVAGCAAFAVGCTALPGAAPTPSGPPDACATYVAGLAPQERVGQLFVVGVRGDLDAAERGVIVDRGAGGVILMGDGNAGDTTSAIALLPTRIEPIVTVDQEGGRVQRFTQAGFEPMPSAVEQAELSASDLDAAWQGWGEQLADAGIHLDFAPVADVVPADKRDTNAPIGRQQRSYGSDPAEVAGKVIAVIDGLDAAGVGSSAKHFPGLGEVAGNPDVDGPVVDDVTGPDSPSLAPFRAAIAAGVDTVMVSTATYPWIDRDNPAAFSPAVVRLLREGMGFTGVVVSDDLGVAASVAGVAPADRALRFLRAGGDLVVVVDPRSAGTMIDAVVAAAASDRALARRVDESAARVLRLKERRGVLSCAAP